jgi:hypothetical protein
VDNALRRLVLQLSCQTPTPYELLQQHYDISKGLTIPTYLELLEILRKLLGMFGRTYLILDALDESKTEDHSRVADLVVAICSWPDIQLHVLVTSQARRVFEKRFLLLENLSRITIQMKKTSHDIRSYISHELKSRDEFESWQPQWAQIINSIVEKSAGM